MGGEHEPITGGNNWIKYFPPAISRGKILWYARLDSNQRPTESESVTLSNWATGAYWVVGFCDSRQIVVNDHAFFLCRSRKRRCGKALRHISTGDTWNVGVWHSIQLSYGHIFSLSIISGICGFCKGKQEKQKNIQNLRKKLLTFCEQGDKINKLSPTGRRRRCTLKIEQHSLEIDREVNGESL